MSASPRVQRAPAAPSPPRVVGAPQNWFRERGLALGHPGARSGLSEGETLGGMQTVLDLSPGRPQENRLTSLDPMSPSTQWNSLSCDTEHPRADGIRVWELPSPCWMRAREHCPAHTDPGLETADLPGAGDRRGKRGQRALSASRLLWGLHREFSQPPPRRGHSFHEWEGLTHTCMHTHIHIHIQTHVHTHTGTHVCTHACTLTHKQRHTTEA